MNGFDFLAAALFDEFYRVKRAIVLPIQKIASCAKHDARTNKFKFRLSEKIWETDQATDVTANLLEAQRFLDAIPKNDTITD